MQRQSQASKKNEPMSSLPIQEHYGGFEVLTAVVIKSTIFWDITPCSQLKVNRRLGGKYRLHLRRTTRRYIPEDSTKKVALL
jgi:hypothetical protein